MAEVADAPDPWALHPLGAVYRYASAVPTPCREGGALLLFSETMIRRTACLMWPIRLCGVVTKFP